MLKKMCANFLSGNVSELVGYTYPKLHKGKDWYVDFYAKDQSRHSDITTTNKYIQKHGYVVKLRRSVSSVLVRPPTRNA